MAKNLEGVFLKEEVLGTPMELNGDKTPSLDGFSMTFWSFNWEFVKHEVQNFFNEFHEHSRFIQNLNATLLVLIPKQKEIDNLKDFRPISLVEGLYKLLAKMLVNRLKKMMNKVVSIFKMPL